MTPRPTRKLVAPILAAAATLVLGGCAYDSYGGVGVGYGTAGYGAYDYDYGYPGYGGYGYGGYGDPGYGYGWYDGFWYPGSGVYVYDRGGHRHPWRDRDRDHWRNGDHGHGDHDWRDGRGPGGGRGPDHGGRPDQGAGGWQGGGWQGGGWRGDRGGHAGDAPPPGAPGPAPRRDMRGGFAPRPDMRQGFAPRPDMRDGGGGDRGPRARSGAPAFGGGPGDQGDPRQGHRHPR